MTILVAVSRTHVRDQVINTAVRLADALEENLHMVHLVEDENQTDDSQVREELRQHVLAENVVATVAIEPVDASLARSGTHLGQVLLDIAEDAEVTHIVVGHSSKGLLGDITQGSTAFTVADAAPVPVTIVPEKVSEQATP